MTVGSRKSKAGPSGKNKAGGAKRSGGATKVSLAGPDWIRTKGLSVIRLDLAGTQATLFEVGRLRAMVGSNALLGEFLAVVGPEEVRGVSLALSDATKALFKALDPEAGGLTEDDPLSFFERGVLTAAAGQLVVVVPTSAARDTAERLRLLAARIVPRASFRLEIGVFDAPPPSQRAATDGHGVNQCLSRQSSAVRVSPAVLLPYAQRCPHSVTESALARLDAEGQFDEDELFAPTTARRGMAHAGYSTFQIMRQGVRRGTSQDPLGAFVRSLRPKLENDVNRKVRMPYDIDDLCGGREGAGYALLVMDGNAMGDEFRAFAKTMEAAPSLADEAAREEWFWWRVRCSLRSAVAAGLRAVAQEHAGRSQERILGLPFELLWLGGDDLGILVRPRYAFRLVLKIVSAYEEATKKWLRTSVEGVFKPRFGGRSTCLTLGAGLLIAPRSLPFSLAHRLAEEVLDSAKLLRNVDSYTKKSVVDWHVVRGSASLSVAESRARDLILREEETFLLTKRPVPVLKSGRQTVRPSLDELSERARELAGSSEGRNRRERMRRYARTNSYVARWMYDELFGGELFQRISKDEGSPSWTDFLDVVELADLVGTT